MASHSGRSFLNSCLKVPIDPCNNCPAPNYNRPKMYLGRLSATPTTAMDTTTVMTTKTCDTETETKWSCSGIRSLAKFYDSIPDYRELNHLSEEEFYSTLETLRSTCRELKLKSANTCVITEDRCSTTSSSISSNHCLSQSGRYSSKKPKKTKKKKESNKKQRKRSESHETDSILDGTELTTSRRVPESTYTMEERKTIDSFTAKSLKKNLDKEVEEFHKSLKYFESELKRPMTSSALNDYISRPSTRCLAKEYKEKATNIKDKFENEKLPVKSTYTSALRERLRKSLSFNDLHTVADPEELNEFRKKTKTLEKLALKCGANMYQDPNKLSNYFEEKRQTEGVCEIPKIVVETPSSESPATTGSQCKSKSKDEFKIPFKVFDLSPSKRDSSAKRYTSSPVHPVARPNLAATLREECSRKKLQELKNNCTYHDTTPQVDWEVRKTPAWKTLSLNETHKEILKIRLATRKAEQALQKREYQLNMELMKQRVKSAPLLLEGPTYWGPHVGKLTHECQREGRRHMCQSNQQRVKRKKTSSRSYSCRREHFQHSNPDLIVTQQAHPQGAIASESREAPSRSQKIKTLRKIYGGNLNSKCQSLCSNQSTNTHRSSKSFVLKKPTPESGVGRLGNSNLVEFDSADELSSLDRAFL